MAKTTTGPYESMAEYWKNKSAKALAASIDYAILDDAFVGQAATEIIEDRLNNNLQRLGMTKQELVEFLEGL